MSLFRLAVLSDLHIDREVEPGSWELAKSAFAAAVRARVDHIVVVGDVFDCSTAMLRDCSALKQHLAKKSLWHRDRLSIVVGNHDVFHTAHHGGRVHQLRELARATLRDAQSSYEAFGTWAGELLTQADQLDGEDPFPFSKRLGHLRLSAIDTTERVTLQSSNARLASGDARRVVAAVEKNERHVLAIHNAPFEGRVTVAESAQGYAGGYAKADLRRLEKLTHEANVEAVVCGHIHATDEYQWHLRGGVPVYLMGRTGGVHDTTPTFAVLEVPERGAVRWREEEF